MDIKPQFHRFAICGFGHIGKRHFEVLNQNQACRVVAMIDINEQISHSSDYPSGIPFFTDIDECLAGGLAIDVLIIATPNAFHMPIAMKALNHGIHVVVEKPMGIHSSECAAVNALAQSVGKQVFVVKQNRYSPPSKWLKSLMEQQLLGEIFWVQVNCYWNRDERYYGRGESIDLLHTDDGLALMKARTAAGLHPWKGSLRLDGGVLYTQFSHFVDLLFWVFGDIDHIQTRLFQFNHAGNTEFPDSGCSSFEFVNGGKGVINFSTSVWDKNLESSVTVIGSKGSLKIGGQYMNAVEYCHIQDYILPNLDPTNAPNDYGAYKGSASNHQYIIENVVNTLSGVASPSTGAEEGMKVVDMIERIYAAAHIL